MFGNDTVNHDTGMREVSSHTPLVQIDNPDILLIPL